MRTWVEIDLSAVRRNGITMKGLLGCALIAVVKADGYGHGAGQVAQALAGIADGYAVASPSEGESLLSHAGGVPVMCLYPLVGEDLAYALSLGLGVTVGSIGDAEAVVAAARTLGIAASAHVELDTGMNRYGASARDSARVVEICRESAHVEIASLWTHLSCADDPAAPFTRVQARQLADLAAELRVEPRFLHAANSGAALNVGALGFGAGRVGIALYGARPSRATPHTVDLTPALRWRAVVNRVAGVSAGEGVSYGRTFVAPRDMRIATLSVGYGDGYPYAASGSAEVIVGGRRSKVLGSVCMDCMVCDVSGVDGVVVGDVATVLGGNGDCQISAAEVAHWAGTIPYEVFTRIAARVPRVYVD